MERRTREAVHGGVAHFFLARDESQLLMLLDPYPRGDGVFRGFADVSFFEVLDASRNLR